MKIHKEYRFQDTFKTADKATRKMLRTGNEVLDNLLEGGLEYGLVHLFYGSWILYEDVVRFIVNAANQQVSVVVIDCANRIDHKKLNDYAREKEVSAKTLISRVSILQSYDTSHLLTLIEGKLGILFDITKAGLLVITGLLEHLEGEIVSSQIQKIISHIMRFTLTQRITTIVTTYFYSAEKSEQVEKTFGSYAKVHVNVKSNSTYIEYILTKHPSLPVRRRLKLRRTNFLVSPPLTHFL